MRMNQLDTRHLELFFTPEQIVHWAKVMLMGMNDENVAQFILENYPDLYDIIKKSHAPESFYIVKEYFEDIIEEEKGTNE